MSSLSSFLPCSRHLPALFPLLSLHMSTHMSSQGSKYPLNQITVPLSALLLLVSPTCHSHAPSTPLARLSLSLFFCPSTLMVIWLYGWRVADHMIENRRNLRMWSLCLMTMPLQFCACITLPCKLANEPFLSQERVLGWGSEFWTSIRKSVLRNLEKAWQAKSGFLPRRLRERRAFLITFLFCLWEWSCYSCAEFTMGQDKNADVEPNVEMGGTVNSKIPSIFDHMVLDPSTIESYYQLIWVWKLAN